MTVFPPTTAKPCSLHRYHSPKTLTTELHHVLPQSWQHFWKPPQSTIGVDRDGLWYSKTVPICPSGHRDVHTILTELMHAFAKLGSVEAADALIRPRRGRLSEWDTAREAMAIWEAEGGSFDALVGAHLYGQA